MKNAAISPQDREAMRGKKLAVNEREASGLAVMTPGKMMAMGAGGAIGGAIAGGMAAADGARAVDEHDVEDPSRQVVKVLSTSLAASTGSQKMPSKGTGLLTLDAGKLAKHHESADYVLDVAAIGWTVIYYPMTLTKYRVVCTHRMQLVETATGRVVAQGTHRYQTEDKANAPNYDGVFADGAAFLKRETKKASDGATAHFSTLF